eukprot:6186158-Pleurochrysis_carterae.AAC.2
MWRSSPSSLARAAVKARSSNAALTASISSVGPCARFARTSMAASRARAPTVGARLAATTARDARCAAESTCPGNRACASAAAAAHAALQTGARASGAAGHASAVVAPPRAAISAASLARVRSEAALRRATAQAGRIAAPRRCMAAPAPGMVRAPARRAAGRRSPSDETEEGVFAAACTRRHRREEVGVASRRGGVADAACPLLARCARTAADCAEHIAHGPRRDRQVVGANSERPRHVAQQVVVAPAGGIGKDQGLAVAVLDRAPGHGMVERAPLRLLQRELVDGD